MKLLLVVLDFKSISEEPTHEYINIGYLVSALNHFEWLNVSVEICYIDDPYECIQTILAATRLQNPDVIGFSVYQFNIGVFELAVQEVKKYHPDIYTIAGNVEISMNPRYFMEHLPELDFVLLDESENTLPELLQCIMNGINLEVCNGILYRNGAEIIQTQDRSLILDLDHIAFPNKDFYKSPLTTHFLVCSRGCTGHCTFCGYKKGQIRRRSLDNIFQEIKEIQRKYKCHYYHIIDAAFGDGMDDLAEYYRAFNDGIEMNNLSFCFSFYMRSEMVNDVVIEELKKLRAVGLDYVMIGIETGNAEDMKIYGKMAKLEDNVRAMTLLNEAKIPADFGVIMFNPYSTKQKLIQNIEFFKDNHMFLNASRISSRLAVFSGTPIVKKLMHDGLLMQPGDQPIIDSYNYRFANDEIELLWNMYNDISTKIHKKSHKNFYKAGITSVQMYTYLYNIDCSEMLTALNAYKDFCVEFSYDMFYQVLEHYMEQGFNDRIMNVVDDHIKELVKMESGIERMKLHALRKIMRKDKI